MSDKAPTLIVDWRTGDVLSIHGRHEGVDVVAQKVELMKVVPLRGMDGNLGRRQGENEPAVPGVDMGQAEDVTQEGTVGSGVGAVDHGVCALDHRQSPIREAVDRGYNAAGTLSECEDESMQSMLIRVRDLQAIARGEITLVYRRWKRPTVKTGGTLRTAVGVMAIDSVEAIEESEISAADAARAGFASLGELLAELDTRSEGRIYRIELRLLGPDPRLELRRQSSLASEDVLEIERRLRRFDRASPHGAWTETALRLIAERPRTRATTLAAAADFDTRWFKTKVRKLKELGLTESLEIGYRLSPRGQAYLERQRKAT